MLFIVLFIFVALPAVELWLLIHVGEILGGWTTVGLVMMTSILGASLVRSQGISTVIQVREKLARGETPGQEIVEAMMLAVAGLLLILPGFITDFLGLILLTPITRIPVARYFYKKMQVQVNNSGGFGASMGGQQPHSPFEKGKTFDGDFEHKADPSDKRPESHQVDHSQDERKDKDDSFKP
ncbi:FxsA family protein [Shewanella sp.]|nr:FxsA family protein [Shewanella sp.]